MSQHVLTHQFNVVHSIEQKVQKEIFDEFVSHFNQG